MVGQGGWSREGKEEDFWSVNEDLGDCNACGGDETGRAMGSALADACARVIVGTVSKSANHNQRE